MSFRSPKTSPVDLSHVQELDLDSPKIEYLSSSYSTKEKHLTKQTSIQLPRSSSIGSLWTSEITLLKACGTAFEIAICLRRIDEILHSIDYLDRIKFCKSDFEHALNELTHNDVYFTDKLIKSIAALKIKYFNESLLWMLPEVILIEVFLMIPVDEFPKIAAVCNEWKDLATCDIIWKIQYERKFLKTNPNSLPTNITCYWASFRDRLSDPQVGDSVEVAWRGKFRLESQDVYQGLAWWVAKVVERNNPIRYKIHYPGWEPRWDEWVERRRLRWTSDHDITTKLHGGDKIELWCCGFNVPGAWLETTIKKVRNDRYAVMRSPSTGIVWVDRGRIRPRRRKSSNRLSESSELMNRQSSLSVSISQCMSNSSCSIM